MRILLVPLVALAAYVAYHRLRPRPLGPVQLGARPPVFADAPPYGYNFGGVR